jgi:PrgI family protein
MSVRPESSEPGRARITADVDRPDRILAGLTVRQLVLLALPAVVLWAAYAESRRFVPLPIFAALGTPIVVAMVTVALGRRDGLPLDRLVVAAVRQYRRPRRLVPAPEGVPPAPAWAGHDPAPVPAPLHLPAHGVGDTGVVDLGEDGVALVCQASPISFGLRTPAEQQALAAAFGRYLNGLASPVQVVVRSRPVDVSNQVERIRSAAGGLPHPALERAARAHAAFLAELAGTRDLLARQVLVVLRDPGGGTDGGGLLRRRADEASQALGAAGISLAVLGMTEAVACIQAALDPWAPPPPPEIAPFDAVTSGVPSSTRPQGDAA